MSQTIDVLEFEPSPREHPLCYPGKRASDSYVFLGKTIAPLCGKDSNLENLRAGNGLLTDMCTDLNNRYMIVGYGSNASPAQLRYKFTGKDSKMPVLCGSLKDYDIVYAGRFTSYGYIPTTITGSKGTIVETWANVLDAEQLKKMNKSEGRGFSYYLARINGSFKLSSGESFSPVYTYISIGGPLRVEGQLVRLAEVSAKNAQFQGKKQADILDYFRQKNTSKYDTLEEFISKIKAGCESMESEIKTRDYGLEFDVLNCDKLRTISEMYRHLG